MPQVPSTARSLCEEDWPLLPAAQPPLGDTPYARWGRQQVPRITGQRVVQLEGAGRVRAVPVPPRATCRAENFKERPTPRMSVVFCLLQVARSELVDMS